MTITIWLLIGALALMAVWGDACFSRDLRAEAKAEEDAKARAAAMLRHPSNYRG